MQHAQQQRRLLPQEQLPLRLTVCDDFSLSQRVRRPDHVVRHKAQDVGQRHGRHAPQRPPGIHLQFGVFATPQESLDGKAAGDEHGGGGVEEQSGVEEDGEGVPVEADAFLQRRTAEVLMLLKTDQTSVIHGQHEQGQSEQQWYQYQYRVWK